MATLKLAREMQSHRVTLVGEVSQDRLTAAWHRMAKVERLARMERKKERMSEEGYCDVIKDANGNWVDVFGEFSYCDVI